MSRLLIATANAGKATELARILAPYGIEAVTMGQAGFALDIEETGETFAENALLKARTLCKAANAPALADDSGLCIDALGGEPGVHSARYAPGLDYPAKMALLLERLSAFPEKERTARFVSVVALCLPGGEERTFEGVCEGRIGPAPRGGGGFGYDPIFYVGFRSFAELSAAEKDALSHRGRALRLFEAAIASGSLRIG